MSVEVWIPRPRGIRPFPIAPNTSRTRGSLDLANLYMLRVFHNGKRRSFVSFLAAEALGLVGCANHESLPGNGERRAADLTPALSAFIDEAVRMSVDTMKKARIPGLAIALTDEKELLWEAGFGFADDARKIPVTAETRFSIQSMSKVFTAVGVLTAVRDGLLDLDAPITRYLPGFDEHVVSIARTWLMFPVGTRQSYSNLDGYRGHPRRRGPGGGSGARRPAPADPRSHDRGGRGLDYGG